MTTSATLDILRPLGPSEQYFWLSNQNSAKHFVFAAEILGDASDEAWSQAIAKAQARHPLLQVTVEPDQDGRLCFVEKPGLTISLQIFAEGEIPAWQGQMARELATPLPLAGSVLARATLVRCHGRCIFLFTMHHSISDGLSSSFVIRDILRSLSGAEVSPLKLTAPQEDLCLALPEAPPPPSAQEYPPAKLLSRIPKFPSVEALKIPEDLTRRLRDRARDENATVHGALIAALAFAGRKLRPEWRAHPTRVISPVNNRERLGLDDQCQLAIVFPTGAYVPKSESHLWEVAREVKNDLAPIRTQSGLSTVYSGFRQLMGTSPGVDEIAAFELQICGCEGMISNLGVLPFETRFGEFEMDALWGPAVFVGIEGEQMIGVTTVNGAIHLVHTSYTPIANLLSEMQEALQAMAF